ncbi:MAG: hypothetical protein ABIA21_00415 [Candidatus Aenigmatarchaeota archaeon]
MKMRSVLPLIIISLIAVLIVSGCTSQSPPDNQSTPLQNNGTIPNDYEPVGTTIECEDVITTSDLSEIFGNTISAITDDGTATSKLDYHIATASFNNCYFYVTMPVEAKYGPSGELIYTRYSNYTFGKAMVNDATYYNLKKTLLEQNPLPGSTVEETTDFSPKALKRVILQDDGYQLYEVSFMAGKSNEYTVTVDLDNMNMGGKLKLFTDIFRTKINYENVIDISSKIIENLD